MGSITFYNAEELSDYLEAAYTYEDKDNAVPTFPFIDDFEAFWEPFARAVYQAKLTAEFEG